MKFQEGDIVFIDDSVGTVDQSVYIVEEKEEFDDGDGNYWIHPVFMKLEGSERVGAHYLDEHSVKLTTEEIDLARLLFR